MQFAKICWLLAAATIVSAPAALAQQRERPPARAERPYRGLFGGGVGETEQLLSVSASTGAGWTSNVLADYGGGLTDQQTTRSSIFGSISGDLSYSLNRRRVALGASVVGSRRYYSSAVQNLVDNSLSTFSGGVGGSFQLSRRTTVTASQSVTHQPFLQLALFPQLFDPALGDGAVPAFDLVTLRQEYTSYYTQAGITRQFRRRDNLSIDYARSISDFSSNDTTVSQDLTTQMGSIRYTYAVSKGLGLRLGYGYSEGGYPTATGSRTVTWQHWDVGLDYSRALSFSRRTRFSFGTGSSAIGDNEHTRYYFTGDASLNHEIGRTWNAAIAYVRGVQFIERFNEPFFSDSVTGSIGGMINRRLEFQFTVGHSFGSVGFNSEGNGFSSQYSTAALSYAFTRYLGVGAEGFYHRYSFDSGVPLPVTMSPHLQRSGVHAYLSVWAPLVHRARRADATR